MALLRAPLQNLGSLFPCCKLLRRACPCFSPRRLQLPSSSNYFHLVPVRSVTVAVRQGHPNGAVSYDMQVSTLELKLKEKKIRLTSYEPGEQKKTLCPKCDGGQSGERSLAVNISDDGHLAKWNCFRAKCGWKGHIEIPRKVSRGSNEQVQVSREIKKELYEESLQFKDLSKIQCEYLTSQGITLKTLNRNGVKQFRKGNENYIAFPYLENGEIKSCRYYSHKMDLIKEKSSSKILYGLDDIKNSSTIIIVAREIDKLAIEEAGMQNCVSVPDVPLPRSLDKKYKLQDGSFDYLSNCEDFLSKASSILLATGADDHSKALSEELARRLGRERCWRVNWPVSDEGHVCNNPTEVLRLKGVKVLQDMLTCAELYPIRGLFQFCEFDKEIDDYYYERSGNEHGVSTGWKSLDHIYRVVPGELTLVTGVPSSGKSEWIDALLCNLNRQRRWSFALCSMENQVREHGRKLLEKYLRKPFFNAGYSVGFPKMTEQEYARGKSWLEKTFYLIRCENDELPSIEWVLEIAKSAVMRYGIRGLVIDPYNELDHQRPSNMTETEYVSQMLTKIKRFAQHHECHVWFVAHPKQLQNWRGDAPSLYDISGSAHFVNKCDVGVVVHRNRDTSKGPLDRVQILVRKVRNKAAGVIGDAYLQYDRVTGEYKDCT